MPLKHHTDKQLRIESLQPHFARGRILLRPEPHALADQMRHFPLADHDDGPDALAMLWRAATQGFVSLRDAFVRVPLPPLMPRREFVDMLSVEDMLADMPSPPRTAGTTGRELGLPSFRDMPDADRLPAPGLLPMSKSREAMERQPAEAPGFAAGERLRLVTTPLGRRTIWRNLLPHMVEKERDARERCARYVLPMLEQPHEMWRKLHTDGKLRENYLAVFRGSRYSLLVVVRINRDGFLVWKHGATGTERRGQMACGLAGLQRPGEGGKGRWGRLKGWSRRAQAAAAACGPLTTGIVPPDACFRAPFQLMEEE